jgi:hypothetical protein
MHKESFVPSVPVPLWRSFLAFLTALVLLSGLVPASGLTPPSVAAADVGLAALGTAYTQNFNTMRSGVSCSSSEIPTGWGFVETGRGASTAYCPNDGSSSWGDTYSYGTTNVAERAFGGLREDGGWNHTTIGASFRNNTGATIRAVAIAYTGEQWRLGATNRLDRLDFQYSVDATGLLTGTWTDVDALDFVAPVTTGSVGARNGNLAANRTAISSTIGGLAIAPSSRVWIRWLDFDAAGADDGLAVDDFSITPYALPGAPTIGTATAGNASATVSFTPPASTGGSPITGYTVTSTPDGVTATGTASPITVTGLTNGTTYTFTVSATTTIGTGPESAPSNAVVPNKTAASLSFEAESLTQTYDGQPRAVVVLTDPADLEGVSVTYDDGINPPTTEAPTNAGSYAVVASLTNDDYAAPDATGTLVIMPAGQVITFAALVDRTFGDDPFDVSAAASSGLPVSFSVGVTDDCTIDGTTVTITGAGTCTVTASQSGNNNYLAAEDVHRTFSIAAVIVLSPNSLPDGQAGMPYSETITANGGTSPYTFALTEGALPNGLTLSAAGVLSGTPIAGGNYSFTITATDSTASSGPYSGSRDYDLLVRDAPAPTEVVFESQSSGISNAPKGDASRTLSIAQPAGVEAGDFLLAQITFEKGSDAGSNAQLTPAGWTLAVRTNRGSDIGQAVFYRIATEADASMVSYTFSFGQPVKAAGAILRYTGVDLSSPLIASSGASGDSSRLTAPGVNAEDNSVLVAFYGFKKSSATLSVPTGMSSLNSAQNPQDVTIAAAQELRASAGPTGSRVSNATVTGKSDSVSGKWVGQLIVLRPAP